MTRSASAKEKGMFVSKSVRSSTVVALLVLGLAACSDELTAPAAPGFDPGDALMAKGGGGGNSKGTSGRGQEEGSRRFTIYPGVAVFEKFGDHVLTMPANVVCNPARSGYGAAYWDLPCSRLTRPIEVTATWTVQSGRPVISFSPDLRFAPSDREDRWVNLSLRNPRDIEPEMSYAILWYDAAAGKWIDESQSDPTLKARAESGNLITRRLKHFSGYVLWVGLGSYNVTSGMGGDFAGGGW